MAEQPRLPLGVLALLAGMVGIWGRTGCPQAVSLSTWSTKHSTVHTVRSLPQFCFPASGLKECKIEVPVNMLPNGHGAVFLVK